jgi:hypothetical protein
VRLRRRAWSNLLVALLALVVVACGHPAAVTLPWDRPAPPAGISLTDLQSIGDLQAVFNRDAGKPRLIMLVSPT